jgi:hypothetical protein
MIASIIGPVATLIDDIVKRAFPDKTEAERISATLQTALLQADLSVLQSQMSVNLEEAKSESLFVAGWRPFVGWTCGGSLAWAAVIGPMLTWGLTAFGVTVPPLPQLATDLTTPILGAMLGLGGMRTFEKYQGVNKKR